jgi:hypothetical protein
MSNVLKSQGKIGVRQLIENQLRTACRAARIAAVVLHLDHPAPPSGPGRSGAPRDPRGGHRAPVCLPSAVRTYTLFGAEGART